MSTDPPIPDPSKKPITKNWKPQAKRTADSEKKLKAGVDKLAPWAKPGWGKKVPRTDIPGHILPLLRGLKRRPMPRESILHALTATLFEHSFKPAPGKKVNLDDVWKTIIDLLHRRRPDVVKWLNNSESKNAFLWQISGHVEEYSRPFRSLIKEVEIYKRTKGPKKGQRVAVLVLENGQRVETATDWQPDWPAFFPVGSYWKEKPICNGMVSNMSFSRPSPQLEHIWAMTFWEPPLRVFKGQKKKKGK